MLAKRIIPCLDVTAGRQLVEVVVCVVGDGDLAQVVPLAVTIVVSPVASILGLGVHAGVVRRAVRLRLAARPRGAAETIAIRVVARHDARHDFGH